MADKSIPIQIWENNDSKAQFWGFVPYANDSRPLVDGEYYIKSVCGDAWLDAKGSSDYKNGTNIQVWGKRGEVFIIKYVSEGFYKIYEKSSGLALDVNNSDEEYLDIRKNIQLFDGSNMNVRGQLWRIISEGNGQYRIVSRLSG